jgi:hypothetical protein
MLRAEFNSISTADAISERFERVLKFENCVFPSVFECSGVLHDQGVRTGLG